LKGAGLAGAAASMPLKAVAMAAPARNRCRCQPRGGNPVPRDGTLDGRAERSDFMIDCLKSIDFSIWRNPASSCRGLHESLINYGGNKDPEFLTCSHE
jgi:hypothetical protein